MRLHNRNPSATARRRREFAALAAASSFALASSSWAQDAAPTPTAIGATQQTDTAANNVSPVAAGTQDIIVTAQRREQSLNTVPMSITAVTGAQLADRGITTIEDLAKLTPGLSFVQSGRSVPVYSLRGVGFFDTSIGARPTVSTYMDQVPVPFSIESEGMLFDLERVEVLKGPQGTLFGSNTTGGLINFIAAKPTERFDAGISGSYASFNQVEGEAHVSGALSPTTGIRVAVRGVTGGAYQESQSRAGTGAFDKLGDRRFLAARMLLQWKPTDRLSVGLNINGFYDGSDTQAAQHIGLFPTVPAQIGNFPLVVNAPLTLEGNRYADWDPRDDLRRHNWFAQASLKADYKLNQSITLSSLTAIGHAEVNQRNDVDGLPVPNYLGKDLGYIGNFSQELRVSGQLGPAFVTLGGNYANDITFERSLVDFPYATQSRQVSTPPAPLLNGTNSFTGQRFKTYAGFGAVDLDVTDQLVLHGGARYTQADLAYQGCSAAPDAAGAAAYSGFINFLRSRSGLAAIAPVGALQCLTLGGADALTPLLVTGSLNQHNVSWRAGVDFKPAPGQLIYANVSKGYKAGSILTAISTLARQYTPADQEAILAYEIGTKLRARSLGLDFTGALFRYDYDNKQVLGRANTLLGTVLALVNVPKSRINGAEAQVTYTGLPGLALTAGATYLDTKVTSAFVNYDLFGTLTDFKGQRFPYTPKWQLVVDGQYELPIGSKRAFVGGTVNYRTSTVAGFGVNPLTRIDAYALLDLRAGVKLGDGHWRAEVFGHNVTDAYYWTTSLRVNDAISRFAGQPRTFGIKLSYQN